MKKDVMLKPEPALRKDFKLRQLKREYSTRLTEHVEKHCFGKTWERKAWVKLYQSTIDQMFYKTSAEKFYIEMMEDTIKTGKATILAKYAEEVGRAGRTSHTLIFSKAYIVENKLYTLEVKFKLLRVVSGTEKAKWIPEWSTAYFRKGDTTTVLKRTSKEFWSEEITNLMR